MAEGPVRQVILNTLAYAPGMTEDPLKALAEVLAFSADDWGSSRAMSWVWGIVNGWDDEAMKEQAERWQWSPEVVARLRRLHAAFEALAS